MKDNILTTLSKELPDLNDVATSIEELEEREILEEEEEKNKVQEQCLIERLLVNAGVNLYEIEYQEYC